MKAGAVGFDAGNELIPKWIRKYFAAVNRLLEERCPLRKDTSGAQGIVPDFAVAHIIVGGHPDRGPMRLKGGEEFAFKQFIQTRRVRHEHAVALILFADPDAIEDHEQKRSRAGGKIF